MAKPDSKNRRILRALLLRYWERVRGILRQEAPGHYQRFPDAPRPCHTCAFNPGTDGMTGMDSTALNLIDALHEGIPFICHRGLPRNPEGHWYYPQEDLLEPWLTRQPCAGWWVVKDNPEARRAFARACRSDELAPAFADKLANDITRMRRLQRK